MSTCENDQKAESGSSTPPAQRERSCPSHSFHLPPSPQQDGVRDFLQNQSRMVLCDRNRTNRSQFGQSQFGDDEERVDELGRPDRIAVAAETVDPGTSDFLTSSPSLNLQDQNHFQHGLRYASRRRNWNGARCP